MDKDKKEPIEKKAAEELRQQQEEEEMEELKYEVAEELDLDDDIEKRGWDNMTTREAGKIGGNMVKRMIDKGKEEMTEEKE